MPARMLDRFLGKTVRRGVLEVARPDGGVTRFGDPAPGYPEVRIGLASQAAERRILLDPRLGAAEAFMDGDLTIERGDIMELIQLLRANRPWDRGGTFGEPGRLGQWRGRLVTWLDGRNQSARAKANVAHHYDIGNRLYELFLDADHMQYSCAYWPREDMTLEQAQEAKLAHIAAKLALRPGQRVLDIGCGWGGMAIYLARHAGVTVHGITLSEEQLALAGERAARAGVADRVRFELIDYRDLAARGERFDRIVSVGMFEHVGRAQFDRFFRDCANMLSDDGVMLLHTIGRMGGPGTTDAFTRKYIFPGGYIPALSETLAASERYRLIASDIETLRLHYARTLRAWYARCMAHRDAIVALFDERFFRMWTFYLAGATAAFESGGMCNYQIQYARSRHALPLSRDYIASDEAGLLAG
ncbi:SAM-dependent methyltransferase [Novosphingobium album (ex Liu et al. 2023)]|uniref:Cyclopropane-fatty-acyl-phospholipid synthase n=1 Tax=Novosphingobium album (ex Liu et al. 2023) TaxID=3031130 RepID=A0ABT5WJT7_9SPHN|nr:cyclopropane-fatty-acyl-phospholipid synthase family protein [Novosphingobium album (ex Liu et al. 2023)]MDE8650314.1 cyclopropane-fatty-acyl-phospholipid synthase [Novosphingobium album (ex Liu et al. 2023)]